MACLLILIAMQYSINVIIDVAKERIALSLFEVYEDITCLVFNIDAGQFLITIHINHKKQFK